MSAPSEGRLPLRLKLVHGLGSIAYGVKDNGFSYFLLIFYNQVMGLPSQTVGLAIMIALLTLSVNLVSEAVLRSGGGSLDDQRMITKSGGCGTGHVVNGKLSACFGSVPVRVAGASVDADVVGLDAGELAQLGRCQREHGMGVSRRGPDGVEP